VKKKIVYLFLICAPAFIKGQVVSSSCSAHDSVLEKYNKDADRLAIRRVIRINSTYKDSVRINKIISSDYRDALIAVYNATALPATDTITRLLNIHTYNPGLNSLIIMADSNLAWMTNLRYNILPTQDYEIDRMMKVYFLKKVFYSGLLQPSMVVFRSDTNSNLAPLARKLKNSVGVNAAEAEFLYGDGNDITDSINTKYTELVYSYGWQECPTGCEQRRYWKFRVFSDCSVEYMGSYGRPLEACLFLSVHENEIFFDNVKIYPHPTKSKLFVECGILKSKTSLTITDKNGKTVQSLTSLKPKQELDLILLSKGIYYLTLKDHSGQKIFKIDKR